MPKQLVRPRIFRCFLRPSVRTLCRGDTVGARLLDLRVPGAPAADEPAGVRLDDALDRLERQMIVKALEETKQVKARAARVLGISERSLWYKLRKHGLS